MAQVPLGNILASNEEPHFDLDWVYDASKLLKKLPQLQIGDLWTPKVITWARSDCSLVEALMTLKARNLLSLPVVDTTNNTCLGIVDMMDIAIFIIANFPRVEFISGDQLSRLEFQGRQLGQTPLSQILGFGTAWRRELLPQFPVRNSQPLTDLVNIFSMGIHRVPIVDDGNNIINLISSSDIARHLADNLYLLGDMGQKSIESLGIGIGSVHFVRGDSSVALTLAAIAEKKVYALPVLNLSGKLMANFSVSDLRGIGPTDLPQLLLPLTEFLARHHVKSLFPLTCKTTDTLEAVLLKMVAAKVHRLWCVDNARNLQGVVSLTDLMKPLLGIAPMQVEATGAPTPQLIPIR